MNRLDSLTVHDLRVVVTLAEVLHFGRTAEVLGVAQPSISSAISKVENSVGSKIFFRTSRKCSVTPAGREIVCQLSAALEQLEQIVEALKVDEFRGPLRLGLIPTMAPYVLPVLTEPVYSAFPTLSIYFTEGHTDQLLDEVFTYQLDAALVSNFAPRKGIEAHLILTEGLVLAIHGDHPLSLASEVPIESLVATEMLFLDRGNCLREQAMGLCPTEHGERFSHSTSLQTLLHLVSAGLGYAVIPTMATPQAAELPNVQIRPLSIPSSREIFFVHRSGDPRRLHFEALMAVLKKVLAPLIK